MNAELLLLSCKYRIQILYICFCLYVLSNLHRSRVLKQRSVLPQIHMISRLLGRGWGGSSPPHSELFLRSPAGSQSPRRSRHWGRSTDPCLRGHKTCTGEGSKWLFLVLFRTSLHFSTLKRKFIINFILCFSCVTADIQILKKSTYLLRTYQWWYVAKYIYSCCRDLLLYILKANMLYL